MAQQLATVGSCIALGTLLLLSVFLFSFGVMVCINSSTSYHLQIAKEHGGIMRFIHVSCLGASDSSPSRMLRAKAVGEKVVLEELPEVCLSSFCSQQPKLIT